MPVKKHYRTIFMSDLHLGSRTANASVCLDFMRHHTCGKLFLIGDILDLWALRRSMYFPAEHREVLRLILKWSARGVPISYVPGNHDEVIREFLPILLDNVSITRESEHITADGKRFLITHGDQFDQIMRYGKWLAMFGDIGYHFLIQMNFFVNFIRRHFGYGYWSLSAWAKMKVKTAVNFIGDYENAVVKDVVQRGFDGVVAGHIHKSELREMQGIIYANCGDFVESCTALVEEYDGTLKIVHWQIGMNHEGKQIGEMMGV